MEEGQRRIFLHALVRMRMIDDTLRQAVKDGASQVVILGAGCDSRAYRFEQLLRSAKVFEVDFPPTQEYKKLRVREVLGHAPKNVVFVPIDFDRGDLGKVIRAAGYRPDRKTAFVWEGVTYYIPESCCRSNSGRRQALFRTDSSHGSDPQEGVAADHSRCWSRHTSAGFSDGVRPPPTSFAVQRQARSATPPLRETEMFPHRNQEGSDSGRMERKITIQRCIPPFSPIPPTAFAARPFCSANGSPANGKLGEG